MSFIQTDSSARSFAPGFFLAKDDENAIRETRDIPQSLATTLADGRKIVKAGTFYPANSSGTVEGIVYEDIDVSSGTMPGSVVTKGIVYLDRLPASPESGVQSALEGKGFTFIASDPAVVRPKWTDNPTLGEITVTSTEGSASGKTHLAVSGYTPSAGESYYYKVGTASAAPTVTYGLPLDNTWTAYTDDSDYTITDTYKVTVASVDVTGAVVAAGSATADTKA